MITATSPASTKRSPVDPRVQLDRSRNLLHSLKRAGRNERIAELEAACDDLSVAIQAHAFNPGLAEKEVRFTSFRILKDLMISFELNMERTSGPIAA